MNASIRTSPLLDSGLEAIGSAAVAGGDLSPPRTNADSNRVIGMPIHRQDRPNVQTRVLFLTTVLPSRRFTGSEVATQCFIDALRRCGCDVSVLGYRRTGDTLDPTAGEHVVGERPIETSAAGARAFAWLALAYARGLPYSSAKYRSKAYLRAVRGVLMERPPDLVVVDHAQLFWLTGVIPEATPIVLLAHNLEHELYAAEAPRRRNVLQRRVYAREGRLLKTAEEGLARRAVQVWTLTGHDGSWFQPRSSGRTRPFAFPCQATPSPPADAPKEYDIGMLGSWTWGPNAEGLRWFMDAVHPLLPDGVSIAVGGRGAEWLNGKFANVSYRGLVPDAQAFLRRARVVAVPSTRGTGIQVKTLDAIASGSALVATPLALRGIEDQPSSVEVAATAAEFAERIGMLLASPSSDVHLEAVAWSEARSARFVDEVAEAVAELSDRDPPAGPPLRSATVPRG
jgi:hypothetical protein